MTQEHHEEEFLIEDISEEMKRLEEKIERMYELQIPFFIVDRQLKKLRHLRDLSKKDNSHLRL